MAINEWWKADSRERYWMEISNRDLIGENLIAPQVNDAGLEEWSYETVRYVRPGDIVLHWRKNHGPALTGYSHCSSSAVASSLEWQSRGSYGRQRPAHGQEDAWEAMLQGYRELKAPIPLSAVRALEPTIRSIRSELIAVHGKKPLYFPFAISDKRAIRAAQAYLVKFPAALVDAMPDLKELGQVAVDVPADEPTPRTRPSTSKSGRSGYGRQPDPDRRKAVEQYAVKQVIDHFESLGFATADVGATEAWDVTVIRGNEITHIEVKGSTTERLAVDITEGEVRHAEDQRTMLIVIDQIDLDTGLNCSGGRWRYWSSWVPSRSTLVPTAYRHPLTEGGQAGRPADSR
ncbi:protein NO VEIN domain-containing protein [Arthrobacter sp. ISL-28]|uniref:protein NO VEIN domain-containing protein n=1 Tax=Arthrobacter sp. ISL-28 TaxID=2819108 RepID=UPI001BEC83D6|nr:DUF3883 domain-containing protein [Arthrobacter sp. ISL-28]MBT2522760.1 DUF3883 domain-containing protein [Arthrobacter sp. ISL-28]